MQCLKMDFFQLFFVLFFYFLFAVVLFIFYGFLQALVGNPGCCYIQIRIFVVTYLFFYNICNLHFRPYFTVPKMAHCSHPCLQALPDCQHLPRPVVLAVCCLMFAFAAADSHDPSEFQKLLAVTLRFPL